MSRVKTGYTRRRRHKKIKKAAKGFRGHRRRSVRGAMEGVMHALSYAYIGRKLKKRDKRSLWIQRLNAATREHGMTYSQFIHKLQKSGAELDRKVLAQIALADPKTFGKIVEEVSGSKQ